MAQDKSILILGGGIGGIVAASRLRKKLPSGCRVILVERDENHVFPPSFLWLMTGRRSRAGISRPINILEKAGIEVVRGTIRHIDAGNRLVYVNGKRLQGDYIIIALGAELTPQKIPGLAEAGHNFYTLAGAESLRDAFAGMREGRVVVLVSGIPFKCPAAPYEAAMLLEAESRKRGFRDKITIDLYTPEPGPMSVAGPEVSSRVRQMVESKNIGYHPEHVASQVDPVKKQIAFTNETAAGFDLLAYVPPHAAPAVVRDAGLTGETGWVKVNRETLETPHAGVYAIGDVAGIKLASGKPLPKAGVFAHGEAEVVADNIVHAITGKGAPAVFNGHGECFIETGDGKAGYGSGNFFAEPNPQIKLRQPSRSLHLGKVAFEKYWLYRWF